MNISYYITQHAFFDWNLCSGGNEKNVLVLSEQGDIPEQLGFLKKVLRSVDLDFETDIHFTGIPGESETRLLAEARIEDYSTLILFGLDPERHGITPPAHREWLSHYERIACLCAPRLSEIAGSPELKKRLWEYLKFVFHQQP